MADKRIQQYPAKPTPATNDYLLLADSEDVDVNGFLKYKKVQLSDLGSNLVITYYQDITYANLLVLISSNSLSIGRFYRITDSGSSVNPIIVQAVGLGYLSKIGVGSNSGTIYYYNVSTDSVITPPIPIGLGTSNQILGVNNGATAQEYKTLSGTTNQVTVTNLAGGITISLPQNIDVSATPTFQKMLIGSNTNAINTPSDLNGSLESATGNTLYVAKTTTNGGIILDKIVNETTDGAGFIGRKARGTPSALANVQTGDQIGYVDFRSFSGTKFWQQVSIYSTVKGSFTPGQAPPADLRFATCVAGGVSTYRGSISPEGYWYINTEAQDALSAGSYLTVKSTLNEWTSIIVNRATSGAGYGLRVHTQGTTASDIPFAISAGSGTGSFVLSVYGNGKIGVNKLSPTEALDVVGNAIFSGNIKIGNTVTVGNKTTTEINALTPATGMTVFNTTLGTLCFYDGAAWKKVSHSAM